MTQKIKKLMVDVIEEAADTQARVALSQETIDEYAESIAEILKEHPIDVFFDGMCYFIGDGWHRFLAAVKAGLTVVPCIVHDGKERDALLFAAAANKSHGLKRTNRDKRRALEIMFSDAEWSTWSDRSIAEHCGVHHETVATVRRQLAETASSPAEADAISPAKRVGRDEKVRKAPKPQLAETASSPEPAGPNISKLAAPYQRACQDLTRIKKDLKAIVKVEEEGAHLAAKITRIETDIDRLRATIQQSEPLALCGKCDGAKCQHCSRTGFWPRSVVESRQK